MIKKTHKVLCYQIGDIKEKAEQEKDENNLKYVADLWIFGEKNLNAQ